eukprot:5021998-Pyramimonas_sp.AAC.1
MCVRGGGSGARTVGRAGATSRQTLRCRGCNKPDDMAAVGDTGGGDHGICQMTSPSDETRADS